MKYKNNWFLLTAGKYKLSSEYFTWQESVDYCESEGMVLASIHSDAEWKSAQKAGEAARCNGQCGGHLSSCDWFWLGGKLSGSNWVWVDGTPFDWQPDFFEMNDGNSVYISAWVSKSCYGKGDGWHDALDSWRQQALCEGN